MYEIMRRMTTTIEGHESEMKELKSELVKTARKLENQACEFTDIKNSFASSSMPQPPLSVSQMLPSGWAQHSDAKV